MARRAWLIAAAILALGAGVRGEPEGLLGRLDEEIRGLSERVAPAVVRVEAERQRRFRLEVPPDLPGVVRPVFRESTVGSGFVVGPDRRILTSNSIVDGASAVTVRFRNGAEARARVVASDEYFRVAVLETEVPDSVRPLELRADAPAPGSLALLFGNAHDAGPSQMLGLVCDADRAHLGFDRFVVVSVPLTAGDSGAPVIGADGKVLGLGSAALPESKLFLSSSGGGLRVAASAPAIEGTTGGRLAACVPASDLRRVLEDVAAHGEVRHAWLGVTLREDRPEVVGVVSGGPAGEAGVRPGDLVLTLDEVEVASRSELVGRLARLRPETVVAVRLRRDGEEQTVRVTLADRPPPGEQDLVAVKEGVQILRVQEGSARGALEPGDVVVSVNGRPADCAAAVREALARFAETGEIDLVLLRGGLQMHLRIGR